MYSIEKIKFDSDNFTIYKLAEGVYAVIEIGKNTGSNAGIIDLGDNTLVFDTLLNIDASRELKRVSEELTGRAPGIVINSHSHADHIIGNSVFPDNALIISSRSVRETIENTKKEFDQEKCQYLSKIYELEEAMKSAIDHDLIAGIKNELKFLKNYVKPGVDIRVPNLTINNEIVLHGSKRNVYLIPYDNAHSKGDIIAYLPEDEICFMGDLLFAESHPWLGSGNPEELFNILDNILQYKIEYFVPGHGRLSYNEDVLWQMKYIKEIIDLVEKKGSLSNNDYSVNELSPVFKEWEDLCFLWNIDYLIERKREIGL